MTVYRGLLFPCYKVLVNKLHRAPTILQITSAFLRI